MAKKRTYPKYNLTFEGNTVPTAKRKPKTVRGTHTLKLNRQKEVTLTVRVTHKKAHAGVPNLLIKIDKNKSAGKGRKKR